MQKVGRKSLCWWAREGYSLMTSSWWSQDISDSHVRGQDPLQAKQNWNTCTGMATWEGKAIPVTQTSDHQTGAWTEGVKDADRTVSENPGQSQLTSALPCKRRDRKVRRTGGSRPGMTVVP